jgi:hypothetical protein
VAASRLTVGILPGIELEISGDATAIRHFAAEYGSGAGESPGAPASEVRRLFVSFVQRLPAGLRSDGHRSVHWQARLSRVEGSGARADMMLEIALRGWPRWFGLSLVQGYLVEPALSILVAEGGSVLLPAAGIVRDGRADLLIGRSGSGKSSLSVRALMAGLPMLGDDQVHIAGNGLCTRFPRRIRVYDDLVRTAPLAARRLPSGLRLQLGLRSIARRLTWGSVRPSARVDAAQIGGRLAVPTALGRVVLLRRVTGAQLRLTDAGADEAVRDSVATLTEQRARLASILPDDWRSGLAATLEKEARTLSAAFASVPVIAVEVPQTNDPASAVSRLARLLTLP